jgi:two-component system, NtrC family, nitrogen regulation sensor histidine kinase NtrY
MRPRLIHAVLVTGCGLAVTCAVHYGFGGQPVLAVALGLFGATVLALVLMLAWWRQARATLRALNTGVDAFADGDFSFSIKSGQGDVLGELVEAHNRLGRILREQRQHLLQRELLLDTVVRNSPLALLLFDAGGHVVMTNLEARKMLAGGRPMEGMPRDRLVAALPTELGRALSEERPGLIGFKLEGRDEIVHFSFQVFNLNAQPHQLVLIKPLTREIARQEVQTWKKVIRVISHELNNSLGPIKSLANSGLAEARTSGDPFYQRVLGTIAERAEHLHVFLSGYADFARLPAPSIEEVDLGQFLARLADGYPFVRHADVKGRAHFDPMLMEQALINLLKNAHESGSDPDQIVLEVEQLSGQLRFIISDRGPGMNEATLAQAMVPFYSTKRSGSGIGLALAREIVEAHDGHIELANRRGGGLEVRLSISQ